MQNIYFIVWLLVIGLDASAQSKFSISAGVARTNLIHEEVSATSRLWETKTSYFLAVNMQREINGDFGWESSIAYINAGAHSLYLRDVSQSSHYIMFPVSVYYKPFQILKIAVGPQVNVLLNESVNSDFFPKSFNVGESDRLDFGIQASAEVNVVKNLAFSICNYWGLKYNNHYEYNLSPDPELDFSTNKNIFFTAGLRYYF